MHVFKFFLLKKKLLSCPCLYSDVWTSVELRTCLDRRTIF